MWPAMAREVASGGENGVLAVDVVGLDDGDDLAGVAAEIPVADAVAGLHQRDRLALRRQQRAVVDVVHAVDAEIRPRVDLEDDLVGEIEPRLVVAD